MSAAGQTIKTEAGDILVDDKHAVMTRAVLERLPKSPKPSDPMVTAPVNFWCEVYRSADAGDIVRLCEYIAGQREMDFTVKVRDVLLVGA